MDAKDQEIMIRLANAAPRLSAGVYVLATTVLGGGPQMVLLEYRLLADHEAMLAEMEYAGVDRWRWSSHSPGEVPRYFILYAAADADAITAMMARAVKGHRVLVVRP